MIHYILQLIGFQLLFLVVYEFFLKKETFFNWNRAYLLLTPLLSFVLPFAKISFLRQRIPQDFQINLPDFLQGALEQTPVGVEVLPEVVVTGNASHSIYDALLTIWWLGVLVAVVLFAFKLYKLKKLANIGTIVSMGGLSIISIPKSSLAFSFFNTIYLGADLSEKQRERILMHETIHVREKHSLDMLFFELQRIVFWFNPLVYAYQNSMKLLQEYRADAQVVAQSDKPSYYQNLLEQIFQTEKISFINTFFNHSLIKKRIIMLQKSKSKNLARLKYALVIPLICSMLFYVACSEELQNDTPTQSDLRSQIIDLKEQLITEEDVTLEEYEEYLKLVQEMIKAKNMVLIGTTIVKGQPDFYTLQINRPQDMLPSEEDFLNALKTNFTIGLHPFSDNYNGIEKEIYTFSGFPELEGLVKKYNISQFRFENIFHFSNNIDLTSVDDIEIINESSNYEEEFEVLFSPYKNKDAVSNKEYYYYVQNSVNLLNSVEYEDLDEASEISVRLNNLMADKNSNWLEKNSVPADTKYAWPEATFSSVEKVPTYPGCAGDNEILRKCMASKITSHVNGNFNISLGEEIGVKGANRIFVSFEINKEGNVDNIQARGAHPILESEAKRVIQSLPSMEPGEQEGRPVGVLYSLPITFKIQE